MSDRRYVPKLDGFGVPRVYDTLERTFLWAKAKDWKDAQRLADIYTQHPKRIALIDKAGPMPPRVPVHLPEIVCHREPEPLTLVPCDECAGEGVKDGDECEACAGLGQVPQPEWCPDCSGSGAGADGDICTRCDGEGDWRPPRPVISSPERPRGLKLKIRRAA